MKYWYVWLFPVAALVICGILMFRSFDHGLIVQIGFPDAEGIVPGRTPVKYRGISIGLVNAVKLDQDGILAEVELEENYIHFAKENSKFYLVQPEISLNGVSGLSTIRDGNYIAVVPGEGEAQFKFVASEPVRLDSEDGHSIYYLKTAELGSLGVGDPILFRGFRIGQIFDVTLNRAADAAILRIGVLHKYTRLIRSTTAFWRKNAVDADLGLFGSEVKLGSLETLFKGGVEVATGNMKSQRAKVGALFDLNEKRPEKLPEDPKENAEPKPELRATSM